MKHPERVEDYLEHIAQAIQRATEYTERLGSVSAFFNKASVIKMPSYAISRSLARLPAEFRDTRRNS